MAEDVKPAAALEPAPLGNRLTEARGKSVECALCGGAGLRSVWSFGVKEPDECRDCGGSGRNWQYPGGAIASYYGGPFIGRAALTAQEQSATPVQQAAPSGEGE